MTSFLKRLNIQDIRKQLLWSLCILHVLRYSPVKFISMNIFTITRWFIVKLHILTEDQGHQWFYIAHYSHSWLIWSPSSSARVDPLLNIGYSHPFPLASNLSFETNIIMFFVLCMSIIFRLFLRCQSVSVDNSLFLVFLFLNNSTTYKLYNFLAVFSTLNHLFSNVFVVTSITYFPSFRILDVIRFSPRHLPFFICFNLIILFLLLIHLVYLLFLL